ncbi:PP2C family protein-serine/threonine phosphatase [Microbacterium xanthum]|uniref:PP2C family protein-serine/threonine phosphatase n=1 Tax=Microbacterium xanthum TaxID=3079794 RepID=UPI002AD2819E|nr:MULTISPECIES: protein phosphatase 2C domain-containing protein [unclassified Microbacterium]MDZ8172543.1 protein phosphatase 2C domain-containing protein [Microbacterium sp. KSW-48]MDZ8202620.1 protein phosphatase 2C domain-containing protein [Microbacterium sp. SSW1-59]
MAYRLVAAAASDVGSYRETNQDAAFASSWGAAVADGVGGGPSGDLASAALVHRLVAGRVASWTAQALRERILEANWDLRAHAERDPSLRGMATTFTGVFLTDADDLLIAHSGDSRAYRVRDGRFERQTRDDSYVQVLVDRGIIAPEEAATHPRRNIITASLGGGEADVVAVAETSLRAADRWLLCSDGLTDYVPEDDVARTVVDRARTPQEAADELVRLALEAGTLDNVTAVVCDVMPVENASAPERVQFAGAAEGRFAEGLDEDELWEAERTA